MKKMATVTLITFIAFGVFLYFQKGEPQFQRSLDKSSLRETPAGKLVGMADQANTYAWLGVPYAQAPEGELRWKAPRPATAWQGTLQATEFGHICPQGWNIMTGVEGKDGQIAGSEDCLYLNIWAPRDIAVNEKLPVMVWIHGGANVIGTGNTYNGSFLAGKHRVIVVTINYRLGFLGWLSHPEIRNTAATPEDASGNYGLLDAVAALQWVNRNINAFGGDSDRVTIFGESAGGHNVYALMATTAASGLFHRAIAQSGSLKTTPLPAAENYRDASVPGMKHSLNELLLHWLPSAASADSREQAKQLVAAISPTEQLQILQSMSVEELFAPVASFPFGAYFSPVHFRDGYVLPDKSSFKLFENSELFNAVPLITGTTRDEMKSFMAGNPLWVKKKLGLFPEIREPDRYHRYARFLNEQWKAFAVDEPALVLTKSGIPVYTYRFDWDSLMSNWLIDLPELMGSGHALELSFVFNDFNSELSAATPGLTSEKNRAGRENLSETMMSYWANFAYTGHPGKGRDGKQAQWLAATEQQPNLMILDEPEDGGARLEQVSVRASELKQQLASNKIFTDRKERCQLYSLLFYGSEFHPSDFWDNDEYNNFGDGGCKDFSPVQLIDESGW